MPLTTTVVAPVTHAARPPSANGSARSANGSARPPVYGDRLYMAAGAIPQPSTPRTASPLPPPSRASNHSNVDGPPPPRPGNYGYNAALPPPPPTQPAPPLPAYANPPGAISPPSPRATLTYASPPTQPAPGQPLPSVQFYSSNQPPPLVLPPRRTTNRDSLVWASQFQHGSNHNLKCEIWRKHSQTLWVVFFSLLHSMKKISYSHVHITHHLIFLHH